MTNSITRKKYNCLKHQKYSYNGYCLMVIQAEDIEIIRKWRNEQMNILRQSNLISIGKQINYFSNVIWPSMQKKQPENILFTLFLENKIIAYGGLTNIDWISKKSELSFLDKTERAKNSNLYRADFTVFIDLIKKIAFGNLGLHRLFTETFDVRPRHIKILEENGFSREGRLKEHVFINDTYVDSLIHGFLNKNK